MTIITSCPKCTTQFVVQQEQLEAYNGKVRCGTCDHIFNATDYVVEDKNSTVGSTKPVPTKTDSAPKTTTPEKKVEAPTSTVTPTTAETATKAEEPATEHIEILSPKTEPGEPFFNIPDTGKPETAKEEAARKGPSTVNDLTIEDRRKTPKKKSRWGLVLLTGLLSLALLGQLAYYLRTEISAYYPQAKPWLSKACKQIGCKIDLPKKINLLTIDDSDMQEHIEREGVLQFSSTLINHAIYKQAYPLIELTLTNTDDEPILKRTFKASEYLPTDKKGVNGIDSKEEIHMKLNLNTSDVNVAGYRVRLSY